MEAFVYRYFNIDLEKKILIEELSEPERKELFSGWLRVTEDQMTTERKKRISTDDDENDEYQMAYEYWTQESEEAPDGSIVVYEIWHQPFSFCTLHILNNCQRYSCPCWDNEYY